MEYHTTYQVTCQTTHVEVIFAKYNKKEMEKLKIGWGIRARKYEEKIKETEDSRWEYGWKNRGRGGTICMVEKERDTIIEIGNSSNWYYGKWRKRFKEEIKEEEKCMVQKQEKENTG